jgi:hypothetical protein
MSGKTIFIVLVTIILTIVLMNNTDEMTLWLFGPRSINKLLVFGTLFLLGFLVGLIAGRPWRKTVVNHHYDEDADTDPQEPYLKKDHLSQEDRDYIS